MDLSHKPAKLLVTGASGSGKTTYWTRFLLGVPARYKFVYDHQGELAYRLKFTPATDLDSLADGTLRGWGVFDPARMFPGRTPEGFAFFCDYAFNASTRLAGRKLFACDELQALTDTNTFSAELALVLETGRRYQLDAAMISQAPNLLHNRIRNQLTEVVTFRHGDERALDWLVAAGFGADAVRALPPGQYLARNLATGGEARGRVF